MGLEETLKMAPNELDAKVKVLIAKSKDRLHEDNLTTLRILRNNFKQYESHLWRVATDTLKNNPALYEQQLADYAQRNGQELADAYNETVKNWLVYSKAIELLENENSR